jgi:hypothetical protein
MVYDSHNGGDVSQIINLNKQPKIQIKDANI